MKINQRSYRARIAGLVGAGTIFALVILLSCSRQVAFEPSNARIVRGSYGSEVNTAADSITVASYNIKFSENIGDALIDLRADPNLLSADILLLQEMDPIGCAKIASELGFNYVYCPAAIHPHHNRLFGNAILTRGIITDHRFVALPKREMLSGTTRIAVSADINLGEHQMRVISAHTSTILVSRSQRVEQVRTILDSLTTFPGPIIIGGDFNTINSGDTLAVLSTIRDAGFHRSVPDPSVPTVKSFWLRLFGATSILDHIFYRGLTLRRAGVFTDATASDHFPIWTVLEWSE
jgi:endonuclease/exonuclease/phosphatase family metal-dependent hydrolase